MTEEEKELQREQNNIQHQQQRENETPEKRDEIAERGIEIDIKQQQRERRGNSFWLNSGRGRGLLVSMRLRCCNTHNQIPLVQI